MSINTTPATWTAGEVVAASKMNSQIRDVATGIQASWSTYTPTWGGTSDPAIGDGVLSGRYMRVGKTITANITIVMGSTTTYGSGTWTLSLPVASVFTTTTYVNLGSVSMRDTSASANSTGVAILANQTTAQMVVGSSNAFVSTTAPWTWANGDTLSVTLNYEAA